LEFELSTLELVHHMVVTKRTAQSAERVERPEKQQRQPGMPNSSCLIWK